MRPEGQVKGGFYPTPPNVTQQVANLLMLDTYYSTRYKDPENTTVRVFDPCAGEGVALAELAALLKEGEVGTLETYGIELHKERAVAAAGRLDNALSSDMFTAAVGHQAFSVMLLNPPYDQDAGTVGGRVEHRFLVRCTRHLAERGILIYIVPRRRVEQSARFLATNYTDLNCYSFPDPERQDFDQVVVFGVRESSLAGWQVNESLERVQSWARSPRPELPTMRQVFYTVPRVPTGPVMFSTRALAPFEAMKDARRSGLWVDERITDTLWPTETRRPRPLMPLRRGHLAMLVAAGFIDNLLLDTNGRRVLVKGQERKVSVKQPSDNPDIEITRERLEASITELDLDSGDITRWESAAIGKFIDEHQEAVIQRVMDVYAPLYRPKPGDVPELVRVPLGRQADAVGGMAQSLRDNRGTVVVGEMGTGKTFLAAAAAHAAGLDRTLVLCPPHMVWKWKREVEATVPDARAVIVKSISDLEDLRRHPSEAPLFAIMSRERAKLSFRRRPAYIERLETQWGRAVIDPLTNRPGKLLCCPRCANVLTDKEEIHLTHSDLKRNWQSCRLCGETLWQADPKGVRRYALAEYIKKRMGGFFKLLVADEVHEYKARGSAQGIAAGILAEACGKVLSLTGTLMGGYSSTLFHLLYRFSPTIRLDFAHNEVTRWMKRYGFIEVHRAVKRKGDDGRVTRRRSFKMQTKERPGLMPSALFHLIHNTVFLRLADVADGLPPYAEEVASFGMEGAQKEAYGELATELRKAVVEALASGSQRLLSTYLQSLLSFPDGCTRGERVIDPETNDLIVEIPPLDSTVTYPKEKALIDVVKREKKAGRRVLVYVTHTDTRDITPRLQKLLGKAGLKAEVLKAHTVKPEKREEWIAEKMADGSDLDALICHPRLVQTGLDLVDFPTICWYETEYSVYVMRQASRRSWRIGQDQPVKVVYMAYSDTIQAEALKLVAKKLQSSLAVEGDLPEDGLATYGDTGDDVIMALARQLVKGADRTRPVPADSIERMLADARDAMVDGETLLVAPETPMVEAPPAADETAPEPEPVVVTVDWTEWIAGGDQNGTNGTNGRRKHAPKASRSLFEWAAEQPTEV